MMPKPATDRAIVFDLGNVLIDWDPLYLYGKLFNGDVEAATRWLREVGFAEWNTHQDKGRPFAEAVAELSSRFPQYTDLIRAYDERYIESVGGAIQGTVDLLKSLHAAGYPLYALSNWSGEKFRLVRGQYPFLDCFRDIVLSGEVRLIKPDPQIFRLSLERIGRPAGECVFIDDSATNIAVAHDAGFATILFESPEQLATVLHQMGLLSSQGV